MAFNLDGGQTAVMVFMGQQLNKIGIYDGKTNSRPTSEVLGIGHSDQVPAEATDAATETGDESENTSVEQEDAQVEE
ncbi:MAG: hypothetical protein EOM58_11740 [Clostridia bacterium]|nr:hypothetical protein [Clostridia bacterium]